MLSLDSQRQRLISSAGGRGLTIFGALLASLGVVLVFLVLDGGVTVNDRPARPSDIWMPGLIVLVGLVAALGRYRRVFDLESGEVITTFWCLLRLYHRQEPLSDLSQVSLSKEIRRSGKRKYSVYPVQLLTRAKNYQLSSKHDELKSRQEAEMVARFTQLDLVDTTSGTELVRSPDELDQSLLEREDDGPWISKPVGCRIEIQPIGDGSRIRVPVAGWFRPARWTPFLLLPFLIALPILHLSRDTRGMEASDIAGQWTSYLPQLLFLGLPILFVIVVLLRTDHWSRTLTVNRQGLRLSRFLSSVTIPATELEEIRISTAPACLLARSDTTQFRCGYGLSQEELSFLRHTILRGLRGQF